MRIPPILASLVACTLLTGCAAQSVPSAKTVGSAGSRLPYGVPQLDFWWAVPTLARTHLPVILPSWLPTKGPLAAVYDPSTTGGFPPITVQTWKMRREMTGTLGPGYSIGIGDVTRGGAASEVPTSFTPTPVPTTLNSPYTYSTDGRISPPVGVTVARVGFSVRMLGLPVALGHGITAYLATYVSGGSMGDFTEVAFKEGDVLVEVSYPIYDRGTAIEIARSLVRVRMPKTLSWDCGETRLTIHPAAGLEPAAVGHDTAWGFRYQLQTNAGRASCTQSPAPAPEPPPPTLPPRVSRTVMQRVGSDATFAIGSLPQDLARALFLARTGVYVPTALPSRMVESGVMPLAWTTGTGYFLAFPFAPSTASPASTAWGYRGGAWPPKIRHASTVELGGGVQGSVGVSGGLMRINFPLAPGIFGTSIEPLGSGVTSTEARADVIRAAQGTLFPALAITAVRGGKLPHRGTVVRLPWGRGRETRSGHSATVSFILEGVRYDVTARGRSDSSEALSVARNLSRVY